MNVKKFSSIDEYKASRGERFNEGFIEPIMVQHETDMTYMRYDGSVSTYPEWWSVFYMSQLPGCCGVSVMHNFGLRELRGLGLEDYFQKEREKLCKDTGYSCIMATMVEHDPDQLNRYLGSGFKKVHSFKNRRTHHQVHILVKDI